MGVAGWSASAYDASDQLIASVGVNLAGGFDYPPSPTPVYYSLSGNADITKVIFLSKYNFQSTTGSVQVTNFQYEVADASVPEPSTLGLAFLGLAVIASASKRRWR